MSKDPACLFFIGDWLTSTAEMDADCRGWYLNLILHNYDKGSLPDDIEKLASLCFVKFSEYKRFEQVFEQVLKHKFELLEDGRLSNSRTQSIIKSRELFKDKRSNAGKVSYIMRYFYQKYKKQSQDEDLLGFVKENISVDFDTKDEQLIKQMFEHLFELYRNRNEIENKDIIDYDKLKVFWNSNFKGTKVPLISEFNQDRKKKISFIVAKYSKEKFSEIISNSKLVPFLIGQNDRAWTIDIDWVIKPANFIKLIEGKFGSNEKSETVPPPRNLLNGKDYD